ncbi:MAG: PepSY domain-containing protein [Gammaproteobacteria bacterium]|nr:PepSY domain-containing protein [Gammaproteobacteria bacterium]
MTHLSKPSARHLVPTLLLAILAAALFPSANAAPVDRVHGSANRDRPTVMAKSEMSLDAAVAMVRERFGGKVISASTTDQGGRKVHVIKLLSDQGRVTTVKVDAESGRIK